MDGWGVAREVGPMLPRLLAKLAAGGVLAWVIISGNYALIWSAITSGINAVAEWAGLYDALTHIGAQ